MRTSALAFSAIALAAASAHAALSPLTTFGAGNAFPVLNDGWRAPNELIPGDAAGTAFAGNYGYLGTGNAERGMAYNPVTGNLLLVSRQNPTGSNGQNVRVLHGQTGADLGGLGGTGALPGGNATFPVSMVDVAADGAIYVGGLSVNATQNFRIHRWASEAAAAPTVAYDAVIASPVRVGDSFAVTGSGTGTKIAAAGSNATAASNFAVFNTVDGSNFTATAYTSVAGTLTGTNDYRLGMTFVDSDTLIGSQGTNARITDFGVSAAVTGSIPLAVSQRCLDYAVIDGIPLLATIDANSSLIQIFDITNPAAPVLFDQGNNTFAPTGNVNQTGSVAWGAISGSTATLYAMNSNQGIQAYSFAIPEPSCISLIGLGAAGLLRRRRA